MRQVFDVVNLRSKNETVMPVNCRDHTPRGRRDRSSYIPSPTATLSCRTWAPGSEAVVSLRLVTGRLPRHWSVPPVAGKEGIDALAGVHRLVIQDFRSVRMPGKALWRGQQDKGHRAAAAFRDALRGAGQVPNEELLASMRAIVPAANGGGK